MLSTTSSTTVAEDKAALRRQVRLTLEGLSPEAVRRGDDALFAAFSALPQAEAASTLFAFWGILGREPDTGRLIRALTAGASGWVCPGCCPAGRWRCGCMSRTAPWSRRPSGSWSRQRTPPFSPGRTSTWRWSPPCAMTAAASAWASAGGYYDRWLSGFSGFTVGCAGTVCSRTASRTEDHDCRVDLLLTETRRFLR